MTDDISRKTLFVLVVLTLVISFVGTWTVLSQISSGSAVQQPLPEQASSGKVQLEITPPSVPSQTTGQVIFNIQNQKP